MEESLLFCQSFDDFFGDSGMSVCEVVSHVPILPQKKWRAARIFEMGERQKKGDPPQNNITRAAENTSTGRRKEKKQRPVFTVPCLPTSSLSLFAC